MKKHLSFLPLLLVLWITCCSSDTEDAKQDIIAEEKEMLETTEGIASVTQITVAGEENEYTFSVTISSSDLGCRQYADWWEIIDLDGNLLYRRILAHSHIDEQPFTRAGGPVQITKGTVVYVRAHMNTTGYGTSVFKGSIESGFDAAELDAEFAKELTESDPLPNGCAF